MIRYVLAAVCFLWGASAAIAQCPGSASPCEPYSTFVNSVLQATTTNTTDRSAYVHGATTQYVPPGPPFNLTVNAAAGIPTVVANSPLNGVYVSSGGAQVPVCPIFQFGCFPATGGTLPQFAQYGGVMTTSRDASASENGILIDVFNGTGEVRYWASSTSYSAGVEVFNSGNVYQETQSSCMSAGSGGPTGTGNSIVDNTCLWNFQGPQYASAKQAGNFNILSMAGGGQSWAITVYNVIYPGWNSNFATAEEDEVQNNGTIDAFVGSGTTMVDLYQGGQIGPFPKTAELLQAISPNATYPSNFGSYYGTWQNGINTIKTANYYDSTQGAAIGWWVTGTHTQSTHNDGSTAPVSDDFTGTFSTAASYYFCASCGLDIALAGTGANAGIYAPPGTAFATSAFADASNAQEAFLTSGIDSNEDVYLGATAPNALVITGGVFINHAGNIIAKTMQLTALPTSCGITGTLYNSSGTVKICP